MSAPPPVGSGEYVFLIRSLEQTACDLCRLNADPVIARSRLSVVGAPAQPVPPNRQELEAAAEIIERATACLRHAVEDDDELEMPF